MIELDITGVYLESVAYISDSVCGMTLLCSVRSEVGITSVVIPLKLLHEMQAGQISIDTYE